jgi:hypothetical protein
MRMGAKSRSSAGAIAGVIALVIVIIVGVAIVRNVNASGGGGGAATGTGGGGGAGALLNAAKVQQTATPNSKGGYQVTVTVRNSASTNADYLVDVKATSADGATIYDTGQASFHGMAPGDTEDAPALLAKLTKEQASKAKYVVTSVKQLPATDPSY